MGLAYITAQLIIAAVYTADRDDVGISEAASKEANVSLPPSTGRMQFNSRSPPLVCSTSGPGGVPICLALPRHPPL